jgi:class 3 adenylate cyclase/streptogramin lyase
MSGAVFIRTFLIADVRGYTLYTQERGDEAAAKLAAKFASVAREGVERFGGEVIELRGDEALAVFASPRQAIRAAVELQMAFVGETEADPSLPLLVGIGLDAGEAVPVEGGWRGGALNLAARLCGQAGPGEVLASQEVVHLARTVEGVRYVERGTLQLKGLAKPVRAVRVLPLGEDPASRLAPYRRSPPRAGRLAPTPLIAAVVAVAVLTGFAIAYFLTRSKEGTKRTAPPVSLAGRLVRLDPTTGKVISRIGIGKSATAIAVTEGAVWVVDAADKRVVRIDPSTIRTDAALSMSELPRGIAIDEGEVWVITTTKLWRIDPITDNFVSTIPLPLVATGVAAGLGGVWVSLADVPALVRVDPATNTIARAINDVWPFGADGVVVGEQRVWTMGCGPSVGGVHVIDPSSLGGEGGNKPEYVPIGTFNHHCSDFAVGLGAVWVVALDGTGIVIDAAKARISSTFRVGTGASSVAVGDEFVWVANATDGTVQRVDPETLRADQKVFVGKGITDVAVADDAVWVTLGSA